MMMVPDFVLQLGKMKDDFSMFLKETYWFLTTVNEKL